MKRLLFACAIGIIIVTTGPSAQAGPLSCDIPGNQIVNCGFEHPWGFGNVTDPYSDGGHIDLNGGSFYGWTVESTEPVYVQNGWNYNSTMPFLPLNFDPNLDLGSWVAALGAQGPTPFGRSYISQDVYAAGKADTFYIQFLLSTSGAPGSYFGILWNGEYLWQLFDQPSGWLAYSITMPASQGKNTLTFEFQESPNPNFPPYNFDYLDNVVALDLTPPPVPEPGSLSLMFAAAGMIAAAARRLKR